ncbi:MAG: helix-turn-helix domain-containing protein [Actinomycetota bacterium]|nr:helix-turn-helix domain-containing protein [Actinomycetota bacterium]
MARSTTDVARTPTLPATLPVAALLTITEAAAVLNVPRSWLRDRVSRREVPHARLGRHVRFGAQHLAQIIAEAEQRTSSSSAPLSVRRRRR